MIEVNESIRLDEDELTWEFVRSSGPGGQNVNKVATTAQLRFDVAGSPSLPADVRQRLIELAGARVTSGGELIITAQRYRSQARNRQEAVDRLVELIRQAARPPRKRKHTRPSRSARERRLEAKRRKSEKKELRRRIRPPKFTDRDDRR